jgi:adenylate kinase
MNILLLGQHGSGKSTQADLLAKALNLPVISTGELFRQLREQQSEQAQKIREVMDRGDYVSDIDTISLLENRLRAPDTQQGFILEGFPRTLNQAKSLREPLDFVFHLAVPDAESISRMVARGRHDDTQTAMQRRLDQHNAEAVHVLAYYEEKGLLQQIDAHRPIEPIFDDLMAHIKHHG